VRAIRVNEHGGTEVLRLVEVAIPQPGPGEVRVKVAWAALNHLDTWVRRGIEGHRFPLPMTPGCDFCGVIDSLGDGVDGWAIGERIAVAPGHACMECRQCQAGQHNLCRYFGVYGETCDGGNAEFAIVKAVNLLAVPDGFALDLVAAFPLTYLTAWHMLVGRCGVQEGDQVLVHAAGSGVSVAATQIAKHFGARVMVTAGSDEKVAQGLENGAELGVNYQTQDWQTEAKTWTEKRGLDIIVDHVGVDTLPHGLWQLTKGGRIVTCGVTSGAVMELNMAPLFFKSLSILGSTMGGLEELGEVANLVFSGTLKPVIDSRYRLEEIGAAHEKMASREAFGKILIEVDSSLS